MVKREKILLDENDAPKSWYNILSDFPKPLPPPLNSQTNEPISPQDLAPLFPMGLLAQEVSQERWVDIPDEVLDIYRLWRPSPLYRAKNLEKKLEASRNAISWMQDQTADLKEKMQDAEFELQRFREEKGIIRKNRLFQ